MSLYFLDSSAIVKHYHTEPGTEVVERILGENDSRHYISRLTILEVNSAFMRRVREQIISLSELETVRQRFLEDITERRLRVVRMTDFHYRVAERLIRKHGAVDDQPRIRTLDALQLAVALDVHQQRGIDYFIAADNSLCQIAQNEQLPTVNLNVRHT